MVNGFYNNLHLLLHSTFKEAEMMSRTLIALILLTSVISGCSPADITNTIKGSYYMKTGEYRQAETDFRQTVKERPGNDIAQYYLGRSLIAQDKAAEALPHFKKAVALDPSDTDYFFWLGVAYGELGDAKAEEVNYERALQLDSRNLQARLYLGHVRLRTGKLQQAIHDYDAVLVKEPTNPAALYNRALILDMEKKKSAAVQAWLKYLQWYPAGRFALQATEHLNALGNFSYENHYLGRRTISLAEIEFQQSGSTVSRSSYPSLRSVGAVVSNLEKGTLQVVVYVHHHKQLARERANSIKNTLLDLFPAIGPDRIRTSWFATSEALHQGKRTFKRNESVRFFLTNWK